MFIEHATTQTYTDEPTRSLHAALPFLGQRAQEGEHQRGRITLRPLRHPHSPERPAPEPRGRAFVLLRRSRQDSDASRWCRTRDATPPASFTHRIQLRGKGELAWS